MQRHALTVDKFIDHAARWAPRREIVWAEPGIAVDRIGYVALRERSNRLSGALHALGLATGDRVGTLAWNTRHHLETYYATMGAGLVCHTLNPRFTVQHLATIIDEADDRVLAVSANLWPLLCELLPLCPRVEHVVVLDEPLAHDAALPGSSARLWSHESLLEELGTPVTWGDFDENASAGLCYTSGTTGAPRQFGLRATRWF